MSVLLTPKQVAERLAISPRTVYLWIEQGRLPRTAPLGAGDAHHG